jgi:RecB family exonuclease
VPDRTTEAISASIPGHYGPAPAGVAIAEATFAAAWNIQGDPARAPFAEEARRLFGLALPEVPNTTERHGALTALWLGPTSWLLVASDASALTAFSVQKNAVNVAGGALFDVTASSVAWTWLIHGALSEFTKTFAKGLPDDPERALLEIGQKHFAAITDFPEATAFWWPRFRRIARWFAGWERERRSHIAALTAESLGKIEIPLGERTFTLRARADRIERLEGGSYAILDYKTGTVPTEKQVRIGISPQLTLEGAILRRGGFPEIPADASIADLVYLSLKGGQPAGDHKTIDFKDGNADVHAERAFAKLQAVVERFEDEAQPYLPLILSMWKNRYGTYDHLARVKEWSVGGDDEDEAGALE